MNHRRIERVAEVIAALGFDGIASFDRAEPEYETFSAFHDTLGDEPHRALLGICSATADYQLAGNAQQFWAALEETAFEHGSLSTIQDVRDILGDFMARDVNARLRDQKQKRLINLIHAGFDEWFVENYGAVEPVTVWDRLAEGIETGRRKKTIVFAMKVYDIVTLIESGSYLPFPRDIPIPCDLQVERVARTSGLVDDDNERAVMSAWASVMESVNQEVDEHVSLLRIDSIVWQAGQVIGKHEPDQSAARRALVDHFDHAGLERERSEMLAGELTESM
jgi:N-glycosylase/DNA lyase